jgi:ribulose-phosphate 3-epimerase
MADITVSASILSADFAHLEQQIRLAEAGGTDWIHIDVMDGQFVPNITMGPLIVETCKRLTDLPLDVHLMIEQPERHIEAFAQAGANTLSVHIEGNPNIHRTLRAIRALGCNPSIVINPGTPASSLYSVLPFVDMILVMTVNPGFGGQEFIPEMMEKIREIRQFCDRLPNQVAIEVDGGIDFQTLPLAYQAGARVFVAGTSIFKHPQGIPAGIQALRTACL